MQAILALFFVIPLFQANLILRSTVIICLALTCLWLVRVILVNKPVLIIYQDAIFLRGVRPGIWKLFQLWHNEKVSLDEIVKIRSGKIREDFIFGLKVPPFGEPSRNACFQKFLWLTYKRNGETKEIYYPHTSQIKNLDDALESLKNLKQGCVELFPD